MRTDKAPPKKPALLIALTAFALSLATPAVGAQASGESPWGLRNVNWFGFGLDQWSATDFSSAYGNHAPGYVNFWIRWDRVEQGHTCPLVYQRPNPCDPFANMVWDDLNAGLEKALEVGAVPAISFKLVHSTLMQGAGGAAFTGPVDLAHTAEPEFPYLGGPLLDGKYAHIEAYQGYSERLYFVAKGMAQRIVERYAAIPQNSSQSNEVLVLCHPESWDEWGLGSDPGDESVHDLNLKTYLLSYITFRTAFEDVESDVMTNTYGVDFRFSHGSIPRGRLLARSWFAAGNGGGNQTALLKKFQSLTERIPQGLVGLGPNGPGEAIDEWDDDVILYASDDEAQAPFKAVERNHRYDHWIDEFAKWTREGLFDFSTYHGHGKPRWDDREIVKFDELLGDDPVTSESYALPWLITEAAFEVIDTDAPLPTNGYWAFNTGTWSLGGDPVRTQFVIEDYARKWCRFLAADDQAAGPGNPVAVGSKIFGFCSPVVSGNNPAPIPYPNYTGLGILCGGTAQASCTGPTPALPPGNPNNVQEVLPHAANTAYQTVRALVGAPVMCQTLSDNSFVHLRFSYGSGSSQVLDVLWKNQFFDAETDSLAIGVPPPSGFTTAVQQTLNLAGEWDSEALPVGTTGIPPVPYSWLSIPDLTHSPRFIVWTP